eukprot:364435-Chlamydomonas_euryale.AAC.7
MGDHVAGLVTAMADNVESHVCTALGKGPTAAILKRMKVNKMLVNINKSSEVRPPGGSGPPI